MLTNVDESDARPGGMSRKLSAENYNNSWTMMGYCNESTCMTNRHCRVKSIWSDTFLEAEVANNQPSPIGACLLVGTIILPVQLVNRMLMHVICMDVGGILHRVFVRLVQDLNQCRTTTISTFTTSTGTKTTATATSSTATVVTATKTTTGSTTTLLDEETSAGSAVSALSLVTLLFYPWVC